MRKMSKVLIIVSSFFIFFLLSACKNYQYDGKDISSIVYTSVNYMGGYTNETKIDFANFQVLSKSYFPIDELIEDYTLDYHFEESSIKLFLNEAGDAGLFDLEDHYPTPGGIIDGGGWTLTIHYIDETSKTSTGDNNRPTKIFQKADYAFYHLYGNDLFGTLPSSFKNPPSIDIAFEYSIDNHLFNESYGGLQAIYYTWNKSSVSDIDLVHYALENQLSEFNNQYDYQFVLWTANYEYRFSRMMIKSYDLNGNDQKDIDSTGWFNQKKYSLEFNRIYVITMTFSYGICTYAFSTNIS